MRSLATLCRARLPVRRTQVASCGKRRRWALGLAWLAVWESEFRA
jgi:hypothetical protein